MKQFRKLLGVLLAVLLLCSLLPWQTIAAAQEPEDPAPAETEAPAPEESPEDGVKAAPPTPDEPNAPTTYLIDVTGGSAYKDAACTMKIDRAAEGDTVWLKADPPAGKYLIKWQEKYYSTVTIQPDGSFVMPGAKVYIEGVFASQTKLSIDLTGGLVTVSGSSEIECFLASQGQSGFTDGEERSYDLDGDSVPDLKVVFHSGDPLSADFEKLDGTQVSGSNALDCTNLPVAITLLFPNIGASYPLWLGGVQVTDANQDDILGDGKASYNPISKTLTMNYPTIAGSYQQAAIYAEGMDLTTAGGYTDPEGGTVTSVRVVGGSLRVKGYLYLDAAEYGIWVDGDLVVDDYPVVNSAKIGVRADGNVSINSSFEVREAGEIGLQAGGSVSINANYLLLKGGKAGILAEGDVLLAGGYLDAEGSGSGSVGVRSVSGDITLSGEESHISGDLYGLDGGAVSFADGLGLAEISGGLAAVRSSGVSLGSDLVIEKPEGGVISGDGTTLAEADGSTPAKLALIKNGSAVKEYNLYLGSVRVTDANKDDILGDGGSAVFDPDTNTLTLDHPGISGKTENALIKAYSMNLIVTGSAELETEEWYGIESYGGSLTFHDAQIRCKSSDVAISATDGIVINGSSISAEGGKSGIYSTYNGVTVNGGELKAKGGEYGAFELKVTAGTVTAEGGKVGIAGGGQFLGGSVTAVGTGADSVGIYGEVAFSGAEVVCSGVAAGVETTKLTVTGGSLSATGTGTASVGIKALKDSWGQAEAAISGGTVTASGGAYGIHADQLYLNNGLEKVTAVGGVAAIQADHISIDSGLGIEEPAGGLLSADQKTVTEADGSTVALKAVITADGSAAPTYYPLWVSGVHVSSANQDDILGDGGKAVFDPETGTLKLNDPTIDKLYFDSLIYVEGCDLTITGSADLYHSSNTACGIVVTNGMAGSGSLTLNASLTIQVDKAPLLIHGDLTVLGGETKMKGSASRVDGTMTVCGGSISSSINSYSTGGGFSIGGNLLATGGKVSGLGEGRGVFVGGDLVVQDGSVHGSAEYDGVYVAGDITVNGGSLSGTGFSNYGGTGIYSESSITVNGGSLHGDAYSIENNSGPGVSVKKNITVNGGYLLSIGDSAMSVGGTLTVTNGELSAEKGIYCETLEVSGGKLTSVGYHGVNVEDDVNISGGDLDVKNGISAGGDISISGGTVTTKGQYGLEGKMIRFQTGLIRVEADGSESAVKGVSISIDSGLYIEEPAGGVLSSGGTNIVESDGATIATHAVISPGSVKYTVTSVKTSPWYKNSGKDLVITVKRDPDDSACFALFTGVQIDGTALAAGTDYTAAAGSTVVTIKSTALQSLSEGNHTVTILFKDGKAETVLNIKPASASPRTGDDGVRLWAGLLFLSGMGLAALAPAWKRRIGEI